MVYRKIVFKGSVLMEVPLGEEDTGLPSASIREGLIVASELGPFLIYKQGLLHEVTDEILIE